MAEPQLTGQTVLNMSGARNFQIRGGGCRDQNPGQGARRCGAGYRSWRLAPTRLFAFLHALVALSMAPHACRPKV